MTRPSSLPKAGTNRRTRRGVGAIVIAGSAIVGASAVPAAAAGPCPTVPNIPDIISRGQIVSGRFEGNRYSVVEYDIDGRRETLRSDPLAVSAWDSGITRVSCDPDPPPPPPPPPPPASGGGGGGGGGDPSGGYGGGGYYYFGGSFGGGGGGIVTVGELEQV